MSDLSLAQDPNELFDVVTSAGGPTGIVKRRAEVHRDGDWHRAVHVWVAGIDERGSFLTFQRRSLAKDTLPGRLDATVGGHFRAGETLQETLREVEEEIGIVVDPAALRYVGMRICVYDSDNGIHDHELQEVFLLRDERPLTGFRPNPIELAGLVRVRLADLMDLLAGERESIQVLEIGAGATDVVPSEIRRSDLPTRPDRYTYRVAIAAERYLAGERHVTV